ncbi:MAG: MazG family protein [Desulfuromonadales bacterium]|nr:MazG family protein [Desulfuromonadales bacterium]
MTHKNDQSALDRLRQIMRSLRAPEDGCPWDAAQTPESLVPYIIEEACELVDAIENGAPTQILDELGDLLLQVVFQAQIHSERGLFDFDDIANAIAEKLIRRHPHVFAQSEYIDDKDLNRQWEEIKKQEPNNARRCLQDHLPTRLPTLQSTQKLISRIDREGLLHVLPSSPQETEQEKLNEQELGAALFSLTQLAQQSGLDAESCLRKFTRQTMCQIDAIIKEKSDTNLD